MEKLGVGVGVIAVTTVLLKYKQRTAETQRPGHLTIGCVTCIMNAVVSYESTNKCGHTLKNLELENGEHSQFTK